MKNIAYLLLCVISFCRGVCSNGIPPPVYVGFVNTSVSVPEGAGQVKLCVFKSGFVAGRIDVLLSTSDNTARARVDYIPLHNKIVSFDPPNPSATACFLQNITDNNITEYNKTFYITMTANHSFAQVEQDRHNLTITIINDDKVTVEFEKEAVVVEEDAKEGKVDLVCSITHGAALIPIHLDFEENSDEALVTADSGSDFTLRKDKTFFFPPGEKRLIVTVDIERDGKMESDEVFSLKIRGFDERFAVANDERCTTFVKIKDSSDVAKGVAQKQKVDKDDERDENMLLALLIILVTASFIVTLLSITMLYYLFTKKTKSMNSK